MKRIIHSLLILLLALNIGCSAAVLKPKSFISSPQVKHIAKYTAIAGLAVLSVIGVSCLWVWLQVHRGNFEIRGPAEDPLEVFARNIQTLPIAPGPFEAQLGQLVVGIRQGDLLDTASEQTRAGFFIFRARPKTVNLKTGHGLPFGTPPRDTLRRALEILGYLRNGSVGQYRITPRMEELLVKYSLQIRAMT